jgi:hypothetical protein
MPLSAAERQAKRRAKLKTKGKVLFQAWVTQAQAERLRALLSDVTYHPPAPSRRKRRKVDPVQEKNRGIFEARQAEIRARLATGEKPTQIARWLNTLGFVGTGATVNGFFNALICGADERNAQRWGSRPRPGGLQPVPQLCLFTRQGSADQGAGGRNRRAGQCDARHKDSRSTRRRPNEFRNSK